ncbi:MAG: hypothetical protein QOK29_1883 [Rhodospirillaceae bacterium]|nr:hypothetical protein [Rhodospirillaceae bacterium]
MDAEGFKPAGAAFRLDADQRPTIWIDRHPLTVDLVGAEDTPIRREELGPVHRLAVAHDDFDHIGRVVGEAAGEGRRRIADRAVRSGTAGQQQECRDDEPLHVRHLHGPG